MAIFSFRLSAFSPVRFISLREMNGHDECMVYDTGSPCALKLLNNIMVPLFDGNTEKKIKAEKITIADRDRLLAEIYKYTFGNRIESSLNCSNCGEKYDVDFLLDDLVKYSAGENENIKTDDEGFFCSDDGLRFRLPDGEDEMAVLYVGAENAEDVIFSRCVAKQGVKEKKSIAALMEEIAPVMTTDISINCPECAALQQVQFDMQQYLLAKIKNGQKKLTVEVHNIASAYGWSHKEIMDLPRSMRHTYSGFINND